MSGTTARRVIDLDMTLRLGAGGSLLVLDIKPSGEAATSTATLLLSQPPGDARSPQDGPRRDILGKLGGTPYRLNRLEDLIPADRFIRLSDVATLRREAIRVMETAFKASYSRDMRRSQAPDVTLDRDNLDYTDNVANRLSRHFYEYLGAHVEEPAIELQSVEKRPCTRVMLTRYCLRRELGYCLRTPRGKELCGPLKLRGANFEMTVAFDCDRCEMSLSI